ncbi:GDP-D-glucose phosphorylase 1 [Contarinia nasturtii]|uniref:GDP-D-glucose phosphorylase 1 n=1 Tax=Contarinia nasturtii TaxID=265458 RepID=UPI0012D41DD5|nr:GDP-D-glucose phosphorylase 1 [Contarinia nasturtii]
MYTGTTTNLPDQQQFTSKIQKKILVEQQLTERWLELEKNSNAFRYKLNVQKQKTLDGKFNAIVQLNTERTSLRRKPQVITSIVQPFDENVFNFKKVNECEILLRCHDQLNAKSSAPHGIVTFLVNNSPLTKYHSLICPRVNENLSQIMNKECIEFAIDLMTGLDDHGYRLGYNSLGAFASVNHLHLHLIHVPEKLYLEDAEIIEMSDNVFKIEFPTFAMCMPVFHWTDREAVANKFMKIITYFCEKSIPHNIFITHGRHRDTNLVKIFIFPRSSMSDKHVASFNIAFCELVGYVPVGDVDVYENLTEDFLLDKISTAIGPIDRQAIEADILKLISNDIID